MASSLNDLCPYLKSNFLHTVFILKKKIPNVYLQVLCHIFSGSNPIEKQKCFFSPNTLAKASDLFWQGHVPDPVPLTARGKIESSDWPRQIHMPSLETSVKSPHH